MPHCGLTPVRLSPRLENKNHSGNRDCHDQISSRAACDDRAFSDAVRKFRNACAGHLAGRVAGHCAGTRWAREGKEGTAEGSSATLTAETAGRAAQGCGPNHTAGTIASSGTGARRPHPPDDACTAATPSHPGPGSRANPWCASTTTTAFGRGTDAAPGRDAVTCDANTFGDAASTPGDLACSGNRLAGHTERGRAFASPDALRAASRSRFADLSTAAGRHPTCRRRRQPGRATAKHCCFHPSCSAYGHRADSGAGTTNGAGSDTDSTGCTACGPATPGGLPRRTA